MFRLIARSPVYTIVSILTLALGIGVTTATFTVVGSVLVKPLPFDRPDQLMGVYSVTTHGDTAGTSFPDYEDMRRQSDAFSGFAFVTGRQLTYRLPGSSTLKVVLTSMVTDDFFPLLRARPTLGRLFTAADNQPGAPPVAVLSHNMWIDDFGGSPTAIGKVLDLGETGQFTVVGVLDAGQAYPIVWTVKNDELLYVPLSTVPFMRQSSLTMRSSHADSRTIARLKDGVTQQQAARQLRMIAGHLAAAYPDDSAVSSATVLPLRNEIVGDIGPTFALLAVAVVFVLLLACADVANLALVRATSREREMAVRTALGAGRARIARALFGESGRIALAGGAIGVLVAMAALRVFVAMAPEDFPRMEEIHLDWRALTVAIAATGMSALLCGLAPIAVVGGGDIFATLKAGGRGSSAARRGLRLRGVIVAAQVALSVVLVSGAGLLIRSLVLLRAVSPGFDAEHVAMVDFTTPRGRFADSASTQVLRQRVIDGVQVPGVVSASIVNHAPLNGGATFTPVGPDGRNPNSDSVGAIYEIAGAHYFATMGIPIVKGRDFTDADLTAGVVPSIVSATAARRYWPNQDPLGHEMTVLNSVHGSPAFGTPIRTFVVGLATDVKKFSLDETPYPAVYLPITHPPTAGGEFVVRTHGPAASMIQTLRRAVQAVDPDIVITDVRTGDAAIADTTSRQRFLTTLLSVFSGVALVLAALGLYGVIAYAVTQRTAEIGVRVALGAQAADITRLVAQGAALLVGTGVLVGTVASLLLARTIRSLLYGIGPNDPWTLVSAAVVLGTVAFVASYLPARRAARVDPVVALRAE